MFNDTPAQNNMAITELCGRMSSHDGVDPLSYFSFKPVLHSWYSKGYGMCCPLWDGAYKIPCC